MRLWPWRRWRPEPEQQEAQEMLARANDVVRRTEVQEDRVREVTRRAQETVRRATRFTEEVDRALHLRGTS